MNRSRIFLACVYWLASAVAVFATWCWSVRTSQGAIADGIDATCRITRSDGSRGTGCVFEISHGQVYVLTAAHVVSGMQHVTCEFWQQGHQSQPLDGSVLTEAFEADVAIVAVAQTSFGAALPTAIPLAPRAYVVRPGEALVSVGCAGGSWATGWKGHALCCEGGDLRFLPTPANGRSGSAILDADARQIVGIVRARTTDTGEGIATSLQAIYRALDEPHENPKRASENTSLVLPTDCGPNGCFPNGQASSIRLFPLHPFRELEPRAPYPTLPAAPPLDVKPLDDKLGRIAELLGEIKAERNRSQADAEKHAASDAADPQSRKLAAEALQSAGQAIDAAKAAQVETSKLAQQTEGLAAQLRDVAAQTGKLGTAQERMSEAVQHHGTLGERIEMLKQRVDERVGDDASKPEKVRAFIHEAVTDKTEWMRIGLVLALALPLLIFVIDFAHHKKTGDPLLVEKLAARMAAAAVHQPMLVPVANVASHAANDLTGLLALLSQQAQRNLPPTVVVAPQAPVANNGQQTVHPGSLS